MVVGIAIWSRAALLAGTIGWLAGAMTASLFAGLGVAVDWQPLAYNFFIAGVGLGAIYLLPGWIGFLTAAAAGSVAAFGAIAFQHLMQFSPASYLPAPFLGTLWIGLLTLKPGRYGLGRPNTERTISPERAWWRARIKADRCGRDDNLLMVPFYGVAEVTQGFDGRLSHRGGWRHALDFQRPAPTAGGSRPPIFGDAVLAPAPGIVETVESGIPDNPVGVSNLAENWGNHVIVKLDAGHWARLAHLRQGSIRTAPGSRVGFGTVLGQIGNSGRSPVPHLHLQVQDSPLPGSRTVPFCLANYVYGDALANWQPAGVPKQGTQLAAAMPVPASHQLLVGTTPGNALWSASVEGEIPRAWRPTGGVTAERLDTWLDSAGRQVIEARNADALIANFDLDAWRITETGPRITPLQRLMAFAIPSIPYCASTGLRWRDTVPMVDPGPTMDMLALLAPFLSRYPVRVGLSILADCNDAYGSIVVETVPETPGRGLPDRLVATIKEVRGPVSIAGFFGGGKLSWTLESFTPQLPTRAAT